MFKKALSVLVVAVFIISCGQKAPKPLYAPDSPEFNLFKQIAEKVPALDPTKATMLIAIKKSNVYNNDIMPLMYRNLSRFAENIGNIPVEQIQSLLERVAKQEGEKRLFLRAAEDNKIVVPADSVEARLQEIYQQFGGKEQFLSRMNTQQVSQEIVYRDVRDNETIETYLNQIVFSQAKPTDDDLKQAYETDKFASVQHILFLTQNKSEQEKAEIRQKAEAVLKEARGGADFGQLAQMHSEDPGSKDKGGLYENFTRGQMVKPFEDASFDLPIGNISDLVETDFGYHIIKVVNRSKETRPFEEAKEEIAQNLENTKKRDLYTDNLKTLKVQYDYKELFTKS